MAVLVTGGAGYIGSHMVLELIDAGEKVVILDDLSTGFRSTVPSEAVLVVGDVGDEDVPTSPINPYGRSKLASEWMLEDASRAHGLRYAILRYFNVAGADPQGRS